MRNSKKCWSVMRNGKYTNKYGEYWYKDGKYHRDNDLPAIIWPNDDQFWYQNGKLHRENDKPSIVRSNGSKAWYQNGLRHRDNNKPAIIWPDGTKEWWINGIQQTKPQLNLPWLLIGF